MLLEILRLDHRSLGRLPVLDNRLGLRVLRERWNSNLVDFTDGDLLVWLRHALHRDQRRSGRLRRHHVREVAKHLLFLKLRIHRRRNPRLIHLFHVLGLDDCLLVDSRLDGSHGDAGRLKRKLGHLVASGLGGERALEHALIVLHVGPACAHERALGHVGGWVDLLVEHVEWREGSYLVVDLVRKCDLIRSPLLLHGVHVFLLLSLDVHVVVQVLLAVHGVHDRQVLVVVARVVGAHEALVVLLQHVVRNLLRWRCLGVLLEIIIHN